MKLLKASLSALRDDPCYFPQAGYRTFERDKQFYLDVAKATLSLYANNQSIFPSYDKSANTGPDRYTVDMLRAYAKGKQDIGHLFDMAFPKFEADENISLVNINKTPVPAIPKFLEAAKGMIYSAGYDFELNAIDPTAMATKEAERRSLMLEYNEQWRDFTTQMAALGVKLEDRYRDAFEDQADAEAYFELGGYQMKQEIDLYYAIRSSLSASGYEVIDEQLKDDLLQLGMFAAKVYVDTKTNKPMLKYIDVGKVISRPSRYMDHRGSDVRGYVEENVSLYELIKEHQLSGSELKEIYKAYGDTDLNSHISRKVGDFNSMYSDHMYYTPQNIGQLGYLSVDKLSVYYIDEVDREYTRLQKKDGTLSFREVSKDAPPRNKKLSKKDKADGKEIIARKEYKVHKVSLIIGSDVIFDYGEAHDIPYQEGWPMLPIQVFTTGDKSMVAKMISIQDDLDTAKLKERNEVARLPPGSGVAIDVTALENLNIGFKVKPYEAINVFQQTGVYFYRSLNPEVYINQATPNKPMESLNLRAYESIMNLRVMQDGYLNDMADVIGFSSIASGEAQPSKKLVGVAQMEMRSTNNMLSPTIMAYKLGYKNLINALCQEYRVVARSGRRITGVFRDKWSNRLETFAIGESISNHEFEIEVDVMPSPEEKERFLAIITNMFSAATSGGGGMMKPGMFMKLNNILRSGNLKLAEYVLTQYDKQREKEEQQKALALTKANGEEQRMSTMVSEEEKRKTKELETQSKMMFEDKRHMNQLEADYAKDSREFEKLYIQGDIEEDQIAKEGSIKERIAKINNEHDERMARIKNEVKSKKEQ